MKKQKLAIFEGQRYRCMESLNVFKIHSVSGFNVEMTYENPNPTEQDLFAEFIFGEQIYKTTAKRIKKYYKKVS